LSGLLALLDDVAAIAKVAAASLDDVAAQTAKAGSKAAGIIIDDAAVTPRYVVGFAADRELPIIRKIAWGSLKNKLLYLLPGALLLSVFAPWAITPLLMAGGLFLCFEGYEKVHQMVAPHADEAHPAAATAAAVDAQALEDEKVAGAIRTDMILSAEIMAIALAQITTPTLANKAAVLAAVGIGVTVLVYGAVALIVKADDAGVALSRTKSGLLRLIGRALVSGMPGFLKGLSIVGMLAMLWVGGGILLHGLQEYGIGIEYAVKGWAKALAAMSPAGQGLIAWLGEATVAGIVGLALGWVVALGVKVGAGLFKRPQPA
jgi:uncharacterized protein